MDATAFDDKLEGLFSQDLSKGTDGFRQALLNRCLAQFDEDVNEVSESDLDMLWAAGEASASMAGNRPKKPL